MQDPKWCWTRECSYQSDMRRSHALIEEVLEQLELLRWPEKSKFAVHLALEEALMNAVEHGNQRDPQKLVVFECFISPHRVRICVEDEGIGFCPDQLPDPRDILNINIPSGRGVLLIRGFMTSVSYNDRGNRLIMEKILEEA